ncbi:MAG: ATP-binding cassette domain-containing protein [Gammaproteobacteria bacterium]|nr:ATP-binding cassette domain-containing protein [Gammaproteobacteria bacterium]
MQFAGVEKSFTPGAKVLDDVTLDLPDNATTAVVGASGSGKTTLLQLVNAVVTADAGEVRVFGNEIPGHNLVAFRRRIGYSVQGAGLFPHMRVRDNVTLLAKLERWDAARIEVRFTDLLEQMGLPVDVADRYPGELSGGQQQRVGLCRALMLEPQLLLLDEPFSAVDPITRVGIYERFEEVRQHTGVSTLLVTHDMREAVRLAAYLVILRDGKVLQAGPTSRVLAAPADPYVEKLVTEQL